MGKEFRSKNCKEFTLREGVYLGHARAFSRSSTALQSPGRPLVLTSSKGKMMDVMTPSRSLPSSKFPATDSCHHQGLGSRPRPVTSFPAKSGVERHPGLLRDHCRGSRFFPFNHLGGSLPLPVAPPFCLLHRNRKCLCTNHEALICVLQ